MAVKSIGCAVIGAGMAGRAHAAGYRTASSLYGEDLPEIRLMAIADSNEEFARNTARRYGYSKVVTDWRELAKDPEIDVVSIVVANMFHREMAETLLAAGKHVLCEKPLAPSVEDGEAMADAARRAGKIGATGFTFRRQPAINAVRERVQAGRIGPVSHFNGHYWCDYGADIKGPMSWRYKGGLGSGALSDIGSHLVDLAQFIVGPIESIAGAQLPTLIKERALPAGAAVGHAAAELSDKREPVENEDLATFTCEFEGGAAGTFSVSRVAFGLPNSLGFEIFGNDGSAAFDNARPSEFFFADRTPEAASNGPRQVLIGPDHPYIHGGLPMDFPSVGYGQSDLFAFQARAMLEQIAGIDGLPPCPDFDHGVRNLKILAAIIESAQTGGAAVKL